MLPQNKSYKSFKSERKPYKCANATFNKYGKEISIHDYIQSGRDGTIAKEIIQKVGGFDALVKETEKLKLPETEKIPIDLNMDLFEINRKLKMGKIAETKLKEQIELQKKLNSIKETQTQTTEPAKKGGNE